MPNPTCTLCFRRSFEDTHLCKIHLVEQNPPVEAVTQSNIFLMSSVPPREPNWNALAVSAGAIAGIVIVLALLAFSRI